MRIHIPAKTVRSFSAYVKFIETHCQGGDLLFRGQPEDKPLLPRLARLTFSEDMLTCERRMFEDFKRQAPPYLEFQPSTTWDWLALAQHHGMATRLLDWTENPLAALWFTVSGPPASQKPGVVWIYQAKDDYFEPPPSESDPFSCKRTHVFRPRHISRRIMAQSGWFTIHKYIKGHNGFLPLLNNRLYKGTLTKITIPVSVFGSLRRSLVRNGIHYLSLFPDIDGLCRHSQLKHTILDDEVRSRSQAER